VRNRRGLNKIGILAMVLLLALGAMGTAYGAWVDEIYIEGTLSTSDINTTLTCGACSPDSGTTYIACDEAANPTKLNISVTNALEGEDYYCEFDVNNAVNSFPVTVTFLSISGSYSGVAADIEDLAVSDVINPAETATGRVHIYLTTDASAGQDLTFVLTVIVH
jgi:hypothetical protein